MKKNRFYILLAALLLASTPVFAGGIVDRVFGGGAKSLAKQTQNLVRKSAELQERAAGIEERALNLSDRDRRTYQAELERLGFQPPEWLFNDAQALLTGAPPAPEGPGGILGFLAGIFGGGNRSSGARSGNTTAPPDVTATAPPTTAPAPTPAPASGGGLITPPEMVFVQGGTFQLGKALGTVTASDNPDATPVSNVTLSSFYIGKYEVTQLQWQAVMGSNPSSGFGVGDNYPVYRVSWYDALVFCNKLSIAEGLTPAYRINDSTNPDDWGTVPTNTIDTTWNAAIDSGSTGYRLPTEAQWEYAAKGGNTGETYTYAGSDDPDEVAWYGDTIVGVSWIKGGTCYAVGTKAPNGLGIYDMSGNVAEWCWDLYGDYTSADKTDPTGVSPFGGRVIRGGHWFDPAGALRSAKRDWTGPFPRFYIYGFRLARPAQ